MPTGDLTGYGLPQVLLTYYLTSSQVQASPLFLPSVVPPTIIGNPRPEAKKDLRGRVGESLHGFSRFYCSDLT